MTKIANKRPLVILAVGMIIFILLLLYCNSAALRIAMLSAGLLLGVVGLLLWLILKNKVCKYVFSRVFIVAFSCLMALGGFTISERLYLRDYCDYSGYAVVSGRVAEVGGIYNGNKCKITLDNASVHAENLDKDLNGKVLLVIITDSASEELFTVGANIAATSKITFSKLYYVGQYGLSFNYALKNITCSGYAMQQDVSVVNEELNLTLNDLINNKVYDIVNYALDEEYAGLALGMLFGDKYYLDEEISADFSATGISHLLAVSGLHVGFLLTILLLLCKLFKLKGIPKFLIISAILIFYAYLCGFSVSVVRAVIMAVCSLYAGCRFKRYDSLNALALSAIIVLCIQPFSLSTVGFRLSYMAVLGIILLARPLTKLFSKIFKQKLANTIATMLAVQIGTCGVIISAFKNISIVAIVANFISIPVASLAYMILFVTVCISFILPFAKIIVYLYQFIMQVVVKFVHLLAPLGVLSISSWKGSALLGVSLPAITLSSQYLFINKYAKAIISIILWVAFCVVLFI